MHTSDGNTSSDGGGGGRSGCSAAMLRALLFFKRVWSKQFVVKPGKQAKRDGPLIFPHSCSFFQPHSSHTLHYFTLFLTPTQPKWTKISSFSELSFNFPNNTTPTAPTFKTSAHCASRERLRESRNSVQSSEQRTDKNHKKLINATPGDVGQDLRERLRRHATTQRKSLREQQSHLRLRRGCGSREVEPKRHILFHHLSPLPPPNSKTSNASHASSTPKSPSAGDASFQSQIPLSHPVGLTAVNDSLPLSAFRCSAS